MHATIRNGPAGVTPAERLFRLSLGGRGPFWEAAWNDFETYPVLTGSGTFGRYWLEHRSIGRFSRDAHSVYLETLAELGIVGLALLLVAFATPVVTAVHFRTEPLVPTALGAYTIYLVHAAADWLWEMLVPDDGGARLRCLPPRRRTPGGPQAATRRASSVSVALVLGAFSSSA